MIEMRLVILMSSFQCKLSMKKSIGILDNKKNTHGKDIYVCVYICVYMCICVYISIVEACSFKICMLESRINENMLNC